ncbi:IS110 family transposase [Microvirga zambiensis]|uniref:IS110 family transposase n=1 Tax=Microvirga zambiensis TaxID=1402137 RepID=UPI00191E34A5|nr:IS110 family transposase [Microvirga zambiensis]
MPNAPLQPVAILGIDIGKNSFHLIGLDARGAIVLRQKLSRGQVEARLANMPACLIGMEACVGAHHLSRQLLALGHDVKLIPVQFVVPFRKSHKNDFRDAEAIAEAVRRPTMRFVPTKSVEQLDLQARHRVRSRLVGQRTAVINQIRAFLLERGIAVRQRLRSLRQALPDILAQRTDVLTPRMTRLIEGLLQDWHHLDDRIEAVTEEIQALVAADEACQRLMSVPGVGPIIASAMVASIGNGAAFSRGRDLGAWLGLVPRQNSTGGRTVLGRLTKRGNSYLRSLLVQVARVLLLWPAKRRQHSFGAWLNAASTRLHHNVLAAALANKLARIAWSVLSQNRTYEPRTAAIMG